jgi:hypothetical protein
MNHVELCPGCGDVRTKRAHPCPSCWRQIPPAMRRSYASASRARVQQPARFQEATIEMLQWCRNHRFR